MAKRTRSLASASKRRAAPHRQAHSRTPRAAISTAGAMPLTAGDEKISELPVATSLAAGDVTVVVQGGTTKQADVDLLMLAGGTANDVTFGTLYLGSKARLVPLANGLKLEIFDGATWLTQAQWTE